jgi:hypothetical protein
MTVQMVQGVQSPPYSSPASEVYHNVILRSPSAHAQDKFRDEESAFGFVVSEHQRRFDTSTKKRRSFARAQDDTGAIFGLRQSLPQGENNRGLIFKGELSGVA